MGWYVFVQNIKKALCPEINDLNKKIADYESYLEEQKEEINEQKEEISSLNEKLSKVIKVNPLEEKLNSKYPTKIITYTGRDIPNVGKLKLDVRFFFINEDCSELHNIVDKWLKLSDDEKALECQLWVKKSIKYVEDKTQYNMNEFWAFPQETLLTKKGDCDDGAILMANLMIACGVPYWKIRLTAGFTPIGGHAYLTYYCEETNQWVAMDWCYSPDISKINKRKDYKDSDIYGNVWFSWNTKYAFAKGAKKLDDVVIK